MDGAPVPLLGDITVLGLKPTTIASSGDEDGMSVEVRFPGKTPKKVAKAAGIARNRISEHRHGIWRSIAFMHLYHRGFGGGVTAECRGRGSRELIQCRPVAIRIFVLVAVR